MRKIEIVVPVAEVALPDEDVETGGLVPPPACKFKEPTLDLRVARIDEVRAMMRRGMEYAEAVTLQAGYFGGESRMVMDVARDCSNSDGYLVILRRPLFPRRAPPSGPRCYARRRRHQKFGRWHSSTVPTV